MSECCRVQLSTGERVAVELDGEVGVLPMCAVVVPETKHECHRDETNDQRGDSALATSVLSHI